MIMSFLPADHHFMHRPAGSKHGAIPVVGLTGGDRRRQEPGRGRPAGARRGGASTPTRWGTRCWSSPRSGDAWSIGSARTWSRPGDAAPIDRRALGSIVFADPSALRDLEAILHPEMRRRFEEMIARETARGRGPARGPGRGDPARGRLGQPVRPGRLRRRLAAGPAGSGGPQPGLDRRGPEAREAAQWPVERKRSRADVRLRNEASLEDLDRNVERLFSLADREPSSAGALAPEPPAVRVVKSYVPRRRCVREPSMTVLPGLPRITLSGPQRVPSRFESMAPIP